MKKLSSRFARTYTNSKQEDKCHSVTFWVVCCLLIILSICVDVYSQKSEFIGHSDQAEVASVSRNITEGNGAVTDSVWLLYKGGRPSDQVRQPIGYFSLYVAIWQTPFFWMLGSTRIAVLVAASLAKALLAVTTMLFIRHQVRRWDYSIASLCLVLVNPYIAASVNGLSDIYVAFSVMASTIFLCIGVNNRRHSYFLVAGLLAGLGVGFKPNGMLLIGVFLGVFSLPWEPREKGKFTRLAVILLGFVFGVGPLWIYNYQASGGIGLPDKQLVTEASHLKMFNGGRFSNFTTNPDIDQTEGDFSKLDIYIRKLKRLHWGYPKSLLFVLGSALALIILINLQHILTIWDERRFPTSPTNLFVFCTFMMFLAGLFQAVYIHFEPRYWCFLASPSIVLFILQCVKYRVHGLRVVCVTVLISMAVYSIQAKTRQGQIQKRLASHGLTDDLQVYELIDGLLPQQAIVITPDPWEFSFHTRRACVVFPHTLSEKTFLRIADRYSCDFLVLHNNGRNDLANSWQNGSLPSFLKVIEHNSDLLVAKIEQP